LTNLAAVYTLICDMSRFPYDEAYLELMRSRKYEETAELINRARWDFVAEFGFRVVLDYGCGLGFLAKFAPDGVTVDSFDVGRMENGEPYPQTGIIHPHYDCLCFFDVLEHVPNPLVLNPVFNMTDHVAVSVPMLPDGKDIENWKHNKYRENEHIHYFTRKSLEQFFAVRGFVRVKEGRPEEVVREDIYSAVFRKGGGHD